MLELGETDDNNRNLKFPIERDKYDTPLWGYGTFLFSVICFFGLMSLLGVILAP